MFYLNEIKYRLNYLFLSFFLTISTLYLYSDLFFFLLLHEVIDITSDEAQKFAYSNPANLSGSHTMTAFFFLSFLFTYLLSHQILDFLKPSLFSYQYFSLSKTLHLFFVTFLYFNLFFCFFFFPRIWISSIAAIDVPELLSFDLTLLEYFANLELSILQANLCFFMILFVNFSLILLELQITFYIHKFYQTSYVLLTIFFLQSDLLIFLFFFLEFIFFLNILRHKISKHLQLLSWHCVK